MESTFEIKFCLTNVTARLQKLLPKLNGEVLEGAQMAVESLAPLSASSQFIGQLRLSIDELSVILHIISDSEQEASLKASMFNMAAAHHATFKFELQEDILKIMIAPTKTTSKTLKNFFDFIFPKNS